MPTYSDNNSWRVQNEESCNKDELFLSTVHGPSGEDFYVVCLPYALAMDILNKSSWFVTEVII